MIVVWKRIKQKNTDLFLIDPRNIVVVDKLAKLLDKTESLSQAMREYKKGGA